MKQKTMPKHSPLTQAQRLAMLIAGGCMMIGANPSAYAMSSKPKEQAAVASPVVVELFTSQSCSSCVAATELFDELAQRKDIVALSWHVDYWNSLNTHNGKWVDPFSSASNTKRQRQYNLNIRRRGSVYTPQIVVQGAHEAVGSSRQKVNTLINTASAAHKSHTASTQIQTRLTGKEINFEIGKSQHGGNAFLVTLTSSVSTDVPRGENAGHQFREVNIVTDVTPLGTISADGKALNVAAPTDEQNCALIIQEPKQGKIIAASYCKAMEPAAAS